jgi:hypothetical protein
VNDPGLASALDRLLPELGFRSAVLLFPIATALHVLDEWPGFPRWARRFASPRYSDRAYLITHALAVAMALATAALLRALPVPWLSFAFFAFVLGPGVFCNALFHAAASAWSRSLCPGVITGVLLYLPLSGLLAGLALREGLLTFPALLAALVIAAAFHTLEVGHNVFDRW